LGKLVLGGASHDGVLAGLSVGDPYAVAPYEVGTEDDAAAVVFEALGGVDASHLGESGRVRGPEILRGVAADGAAPLHVPWPLPVPLRQVHVVDEVDEVLVVVEDRFAPRPAEAGRHARLQPVCLVGAEHRFEFLGGLGDCDGEEAVAFPRDGTARGKAQQAQDPLLVGAAASAAELSVEVDVPDGQALGLRRGVDLVDPSHLAGSSGSG
jgi:hypothetical protein